MMRATVPVSNSFHTSSTRVCQQAAFTMTLVPEDRDTASTLDRAEALGKSDPAQAEALYRSVLDHKAGTSLALATQIQLIQTQPMRPS